MEVQEMRDINEKIPNNAVPSIVHGIWNIVG